MNQPETTSQPANTHHPDAARRAFLDQTLRERIGTFWWSFVWGVFFRLSPPAANSWRIMLLRLFGAGIDSSAFIAPSTRIFCPWSLSIGSDVVIAHGVILNCIGGVTIGEKSRISQYAHLCSATHDYSAEQMPILRCPITICREVWIAADAFVGPNVTCEDGSLLAARSSAFRDLPAQQVCIGEPARPQHRRFGAEGDSGSAP